MIGGRYAGAGESREPEKEKQDNPAADPHPGSISDGTQPQAREVPPPQSGVPAGTTPENPRKASDASRD